MIENKKVLFAALITAVALFTIRTRLDQYQTPVPVFDTAFTTLKKVTVPRFKLGEQGNINNTVFRGKWSLIFFGYGSCPDVCPTELYNLANVAAIMAGSDKVMPQVLFISVDPDRDSNAMLQSFAKFYHPDFIGLTGEADEVDKLVKTFGVIYQKAFLADNGEYISVPYGSPLPEEYAESYLINHSSRIYLVSPEGKYVATFAPPHSAEQIAADLMKLEPL